MAREVVWAESAINSLLEAAEFIAKDSPSYASALTVRAERAAASLLQFSDRGRRVPEFRDAQIRELIIDSYRLIYRASKDLITVIAFIHTARDLPNLVERGEI